MNQYTLNEHHGTYLPQGISTLQGRREAESAPGQYFDLTTDKCRLTQPIRAESFLRQSAISFISYFTVIVNL